MIFRSNSKFTQNLECSSLKFTYLITMKFGARHNSYMSWCVQNFVVIGGAHFKLEHSKFWLNFKFHRNTFMQIRKNQDYHKISNIRAAKSQNLNVSLLNLQLSLRNISTHPGPVDLRKWAIFNTILMSPKSWLSQEDLDAGCEHSLVPMDS